MGVYRRVRDLREDNDKTQRQVAEYLCRLPFTSVMSEEKENYRFGRQSNLQIIIRLRLIIL